MNTIRPVMEECAAEASRIARAVPATTDLSGPTPCGKWDTRTLVNHWVVYTSHGLEHRAMRTELPAELVERDFTADPAWAERYVTQLRRGVAAWADPAVWEGTIGSGDAATPAPAIGAMLVAEMALHGWDVARATGQEFRLSGSSATFLLDFVEEQGAMYRRFDGFEEAVPLPATASVLDRALALSGRDPHGRA
jgi:uncharacterized protein (TIGR03086 family)